MRIRPLAVIACLLAAPALAQENPLAAPAKQPGAQSQGSKVTLVNAGAEPRLALRFRPEVGSTQTVQMIMKMSQATEMAGMPAQQMSIPTISMPMVVSITAVADNGDITESVTFGRPSAASEDPQAAMMVDAMNEGLVGLENAVATAVVSDRGVVGETSFRLAAAGDPAFDQMASQMSDSMKQFSVPVPEEEVGVGGVWTVEFQTDLQGIRSAQVATYTVRSLDNGGCVLDVRVTQNAQRQELNNPGLPPGVILQSLTGDSTGSTTFSFARVMPLHAVSSGTIKTHMSMDQGGQPLDIRQTMQMEMSVRDTQGEAAPKPE